MSDLPFRESVYTVDDPEVFGRLVEQLLRDGADVIVGPWGHSVEDSSERPDTSSASTRDRPADRPEVQVVLRRRLASLEWVSLATCWAWLGGKTTDDGRSLGLQTALLN